MGARLDTRGIAVGSVWRGPSGMRYRVVEITRNGIELTCLDLRGGLTARPLELRRDFTLEAER
jgi:hypothetical protein